MSEQAVVYYSPELIEVLKHNLSSVSDSTMHKIMEPECGACAYESIWLETEEQEQ